MKEEWKKIKKTKEEERIYRRKVEESKEKAWEKNIRKDKDGGV